MSEKEIIYIGDPMCSWCWGFSPVLNRIRTDYGAMAPMRVIVGGLHAFDTEPMNDEYKARIRSHWQHVAAASGQPFNYAFFDRQGFVLDTEPACRATVTVRNLKPEAVWPFYESIHKGFYVEDTDTTALATFISYAQREDMDGDEFKAAFESDAMRQETLEDFSWCQQAGVTGFPTVVLREDRHMAALAVGFRQFEDLKPTLDAWTAGEFSLAQNAETGTTH